MNKINVLDVTLRDGGCVNDFNFGQAYMEKILMAQESAGIDVIELGYIDEIKGSTSGRTQYINEQVITQCLLKKKKEGVTYVAMMDYGKFDVDNLHPRTPDSIDGLRVAFHKKNMHDIIPLGRKIIEKGYQMYIQPMITLRYTDAELIEFIEMVNKELPNASGFYIVDSFGEMRPNDMSRVLNLVDHNLIPSMALGFHSHNNLQMSYSNACALLQFPTNRNVMLDCSIMGMGKGAGNLNTELLLEHLNIYYGKHYKIAPLLEVIDKVVNQLRSENYWGYAPEYYLSSAYHCTPSYASFFYNKHMLSIDQVGELLGKIRDDKKISFDKNYAEELYIEHNAAIKVDDSGVVGELKKAILGKEVLLVAPGKSLSSNMDTLQEATTQNNVFSIGLNVNSNLGLNLYFATKQELFNKLQGLGVPILTTSAVVKGARGNVKVLNYEKWIDNEPVMDDSSLTIMLNLLYACGANRIKMIGFDGFSTNINENYYNPVLRRPVNEEQMIRRNERFKNKIQMLKTEGVGFTFLTPSKYE